MIAFSASFDALNALPCVRRVRDPFPEFFCVICGRGFLWRREGSVLNHEVDIVDASLVLFKSGVRSAGRGIQEHHGSNCVATVNIELIKSGRRSRVFN